MHIMDDRSTVKKSNLNHLAMDGASDSRSDRVIYQRKGAAGGCYEDVKTITSAISKPAKYILIREEHALNVDKSQSECLFPRSFARHICSVQLRQNRTAKHDERYGTTPTIDSY
jgi:hypothetical protein